MFDFFFHSPTLHGRENGERSLAASMLWCECPVSFVQSSRENVIDIYIYMFRINILVSSLRLWSDTLALGLERGRGRGKAIPKWSLFAFPFKNLTRKLDVLSEGPLETRISPVIWCRISPKAG